MWTFFGTSAFACRAQLRIQLGNGGPSVCLWRATRGCSKTRGSADWMPTSRPPTTMPTWQLLLLSGARKACAR
eukprot:5368232-Pyramimonas_sp.AAC.1